MTCPACGQAMASGHERCSFCGAMVAPAVEGSLAPDHASLTPPARGRGDAIRDLTGHRRRERTWKDEVKDRLRSRQEKKPGGRTELPLFSGALSEEPEADLAPEPAADAGPPPPPVAPLSVEDTPLARFESGPESRPTPRDTRPVERSTRFPERENKAGSAVGAAELFPPETSGADLADLPLRPQPALDPIAARAVPPSLDDEALAATDEDEWPLELPAAPPEAPAVERPAFARERALAAGLDFAVLAGTAAVVLYFAGRAARVPVAGLLPAWPWLVAYLSFLGLVYAGYFTGTTGQTLGKMATGLRVVDRAGHPPGFLLAFARGFVGAAGVALAGVGLLPMLFDPARRTLHDRVFRMRVVRR